MVSKLWCGGDLTQANLGDAPKYFIYETRLFIKLKTDTKNKVLAN